MRVIAYPVQNLKASILERECTHGRKTSLRWEWLRPELKTSTYQSKCVHGSRYSLFVRTCAYRSKTSLRWEWLRTQRKTSILERECTHGRKHTKCWGPAPIGAKPLWDASNCVQSSNPQPIRVNASTEADTLDIWGIAYGRRSSPSTWGSALGVQHLNIEEEVRTRRRYYKRVR